MWLTRPAVDQMRVTKDTAAPIHIKIIPMIIGAASMLAFAEINGRTIFPLLEVSQHIQATLFIAGCVLTAYGLGAFVDFKPARWLTPHYLLLGAVIAVALFLRLNGLASDVHFMIDEMHFFDGIRDLWREPNLPLLRPLNGIAQFPYFFSYLQQIALGIFGGDFFGVLAFAFLISALKTNRAHDYVPAGLCWGLTAYWYEGGRLVFLGVFIVWLGFVLVIFRPRSRGAAMPAYRWIASMRCICISRRHEREDLPRPIRRS